jgi:hypothetical protein
LLPRKVIVLGGPYRYTWFRTYEDRGTNLCKEKRTNERERKVKGKKRKGRGKEKKRKRKGHEERGCMRSGANF